MTPTFKKLRHFQSVEFFHPEEMQPAFLLLLDNIRDIADTPFRLTSDSRSPDENKRVGGSPTSLHMVGTAVDFVISPWNAAQLWKVVRAVALVESAYSVTFELEISQSPSDRHFHIGLQKKGAGELILAFERAI
ncbi:hypothetical protein LCGC14_3083020 [marine sediment metagenome]|uniref:Peptidase M15A C-terminal domain-containing protein n=1 Tax=marine sediment metagenome TaxID=412755 RepID=A0A0F8YKB6_9ZZZZ